MLAERASAAGAHIVEGVVLDYAERSRSGWSLVFRSSEGEMNVQATLVVDATGRQAQFVRHQGVGVKEIGDLFALATWLDVPSSEGPELGALVVEASFLGWCSLQMIPDAGYSAVFYTSRGLMRQKGLGASDLAAQMLSDLPYISDILSKSDLRLSKIRGFPSYPAVADQMYGPGWIAVGEAGAVFDPICGRGVELAFESAFRAYEAVTADPDFESLGSLYTKAISSKLEDHIIRRREVYEEAGHVFCAQFMNSAVQIAH
jgi:flavin-dependent dehydrogenase